MQKPIKPIEPKENILIYEVVDYFDSSEFNKLDNVEKQIKYIEQCKYKFVQNNPNIKIVKFKIKLNHFFTEVDLILLVCRYQTEEEYNNKLKLYKRDLDKYLQKVNEYKECRKRLYLEFKNEFY